MNDMTIRSDYIEGVSPERFIRATELHRRTEANVHSAAMSLVEVGRCLKEMKESRLYAELGFSSLEEYSEDKLGIKRSQAYKMIQVSENLPEDFVQSTGQIGIEKLALLALATPEERETVQEQVDLSEVTVKELKAQIASLRKENKDLENERNTAQAEAMHSHALIGEAEKARHRADDRIAELTAKVTELESRPIETAVQEVPDPKQQEKIDELTTRLRQNEAEYTQRMQAAQREHADRLREVQQELAKAQAAVKPDAVADTKGIFKAYLTAASDGMKRLCEFLEQHKQDENMTLYLDKSSSVITMAVDVIAALKGES